MSGPTLAAAPGCELELAELELAELVCISDGASQVTRTSPRLDFWFGRLPRDSAQALALGVFFGGIFGDCGRFDMAACR